MSDIRKEDISGIRIQVVESDKRPFMKFALFIQVDGKDFYELPERPSVEKPGDSILVRFPEDPVITIR